MMRTLALIFFVFFLTPIHADEARAPSPSGIPVSEEAEMAASGDFYYTLHLNESYLALCHSGVELTRYSIDSLTLREPRFFRTVGNAGMSYPNLWTDSSLYPEWTLRRVTIVPGDESTRPSPDVAGIIPPTMEELIPVPDRFEIRYREDHWIRFSLQGEIPGSKKPFESLSNRLLRWIRNLNPSPPHKGMRIDIVLSGTEGARLYRSYVDHSSLLILP
ncbi:MAG TPA: hypothetical protein PLD04_05935 [Thermoanaerobaculia bacterium]|nr:hypothetical protein [Thermoanaerobaculia bacterium]